MHGLLDEADELPEGVPLVSHPLWRVLASCLQYKLHHLTQVHSKKHINILELESALEVERRLANRRANFRYLLGLDSQVALAALIKGRSGSCHLNRCLQASLGVYLGAGAYGAYGYVPSLSNVSDDPTRKVPIRAPEEAVPSWLSAAFLGQFEELDEWLSKLGFDPAKLAQVPFESVEPSLSDLKEDLLQPLRNVQKPERLRQFDAKRHAKTDVSHQCLKEEGRKNRKRELQEPDGQTKTDKKERSKGRNEPGPPEGKNEPGPSHCVVSKRVAPPLVQGVTKNRLGRVSTSSSRYHKENQLSPELSDAASTLLASFPRHQFFFAGRRVDDDFVPQRRGFLDLYSGKAEVARQISKLFNVWVLTFDFEHGAEENLLEVRLQERIHALLQADAFLGAGAAPECSSFSRAVVPPVRDRDHPEGLPLLTQRMERKVSEGNRHAAFVLSVLIFCRDRNLAYWAENPDGSFMWLLVDWLDSGISQFSESYRFDMCRYGTPWRKRTRVPTNTDLGGIRELCLGQHSHLRLRGRSTAHQLNWTRVAQAYPKKFALKLAKAMGKKAGLMSVPARRTGLCRFACARCSHCRIGEAKNPGPSRGREHLRRDPAALLSTPLVGVGTLKIQMRVWEQFQSWLSNKFADDVIDQVFVCPSLAVQLLRSYGIQLYSEGKALYELRHLFVFLQQKYPSLRPAMSPCWQLVSQWEEAHPLQHRRPLHETLFQAMFVLCWLWRWSRFGACLLLGMEGIARIGEILKAVRCDLVLPSEQFDPHATAAFLRVRKPKTLRRGKGRVQHLKVENQAAIAVFDRVFANLDDCLQLFPGSARAFRTRWDRLLGYLDIPVRLRPTPSGIRGGGSHFGLQTQ